MEIAHTINWEPKYNPSWSLQSNGYLIITCLLNKWNNIYVNEWNKTFWGECRDDKGIGWIKKIVKKAQTQW